MMQREFPTLREWVGWWIPPDMTGDELRRALRDSFLLARYDLAASLHALYWSLPRVMQLPIDAFRLLMGWE